ncbi:protein kinase domain-containing protein [Neorhodopirellula pilleata]|nr:protein kinase [Neorhodopirellula pilleata]
MKQCPKCGVDLPEKSPAGMCPKCLLGAGFDSLDGSQPTPGGTQTSARPGSFVPLNAESLAPHFPQLEISQLLGHGGMGAVYKARQKKLDRDVALKIVRPESASDQTFAERFGREARVLARLSHPNIVAIYDFGEVTIPASDGESAAPLRLYYFLMEYVDGTDLRQVIEGGELQPAQALAIVPPICDALQYAHDHGVVHRDIKPANILIDRQGQVKIADFGLAKLASASDQDFTLTDAYQVMGTPRYMAPEQMKGSHAVDHRADIYSLGVVFYEMLTGQIPAGHFAPPSKKVQIDVRLDEVVLRSLSSEPDRRYQQVSEVKHDLDSIAKSDFDVEAAQSSSASTSSGSSYSGGSENGTAAADHPIPGRRPTRSEFFILLVATAILFLAMFSWHSSLDAERLDGDQVSVGAVTLEYWQFGVTASQTPLSIWHSTLAFREKATGLNAADWFVEIPNTFLIVAACVLIGTIVVRQFGIAPKWAAALLFLLVAFGGMLHSGMVTCALLQGTGQLRLPPLLMCIGFGLVILITVFQAVHDALSLDLDLQHRISGFGLLVTGIAAVVIGLGNLILVLLASTNLVPDQGLPPSQVDVALIFGLCIALLIAGGVVIFGARAFLNRSSFTWALIASIFGQPIGLWALWILQSRGIRETFGRYQTH